MAGSTGSSATRPDRRISWRKRPSSDSVMRSGNPLWRSTTTSSWSPLPPGPASLLGDDRGHQPPRVPALLDGVGHRDVGRVGDEGPHHRAQLPAQGRPAEGSRAGRRATLIVSKPWGPLPKSTSSWWVPVVALKAVSSVTPIPVTRSSPAAVVTNDQRRVVAAAGLGRRAGPVVDLAVEGDLAPQGLQRRQRPRHPGPDLRRGDELGLDRRRARSRRR